MRGAFAMSALPPKADITGRGLDVRFVHLPDKYRPLLLTAIFTGLRASELRGLRWEDVDLPHAKLHVRQRADRYNKIDKPKSESSERTVPLTPIVVNTLREWKLRCPKGEHGKLEFSSLPAQARSSTTQHRPARLGTGTYCCRYCHQRRQAEVPRLTFVAPLLCVVVHQSR